MKKVSKNFLIICGIFLIMGIVGVSAIYLSNVSLINSFKTLTYKVDVEEEFYNDWGTKKIKVINSEETNADVVLRVSFNESFSKDNDILSNEINGQEVVEKDFSNDFLTHFSKTDRVLHPKTNKRLHISLKKLSYFCILPSISIRYKKDRNIIIPLMIHHLTMDHLWSFLRGRADIYIRQTSWKKRENIKISKHKNCGTTYHK